MRMKGALFASLLAVGTMACGLVAGADFSDLGLQEDSGVPLDAAVVADAGPPPQDAGGPSVQGGIFTLGGAGSATLPDGAPVALFDQGFELGGAACDSSGSICVTGAITP